MIQSPKIIAVVGPTGSGKSEFAVKLAKKYNGEIISADSRQVYKGLNIGTGKVPGKWLPEKYPSRGRNIMRPSVFVYKNIPHYCIDYVSPKRQYTVTDFKRDAERAILDILARGKVPILCGGTGLYIDAVLFNHNIPEVPPNPKYRKKLATKSTAQLFALLFKKDPDRARTVDPHNPRRLVRALEIIQATGKPIPLVQKGNPFATKGLPFFPEIYYLHPPRAVLYKNIERRLKAWLKKDALCAEIRKLRAAGISWKRIREFGLEYAHASNYLRGKTDYQTMYAQSLKSIQQYAKRQETWFKKYKINAEPQKTEAPHTRSA